MGSTIRTAPPDADALKAWEQIMAIASEHCLIAQAAGGVATLATPSAQRKAGIRDRVLFMERADETPDEGGA